MFIIICGGGKVGSSLAHKMAAEKKNKVVIIEQDADICQRLAGELNAIVINGDACEPGYLEEAQAKHADVVVAVTGDDEDNLVICQLAKTYFSVPRTVARVNDPRNEYTFTQLGVDVPVNATTVLAQAITQEVSLNEITTVLKLKQGKLSIVQAKITKHSAFSKHVLKDIAIPHGCIVVSVLRKGELIVPQGSTSLEVDDEVLAVTTPDSERAFQKLLGN